MDYIVEYEIESGNQSGVGGISKLERKIIADSKELAIMDALKKAARIANHWHVHPSTGFTTVILDKLLDSEGNIVALESLTGKIMPKTSDKDRIYLDDKGRPTIRMNVYDHMIHHEQAIREMDEAERTGTSAA